MSSPPQPSDAVWLDALPEPACLVDSGGALVHANPAWIAATSGAARTPQASGEVETLPLADGRRLLRRASRGTDTEALVETRARLAEAVADLRRLETAHESAGIGFWRLDIDGGEVWWSDEVYRIHGREVGDHPTLEEAVEHYAPQARPVITAAIERAVERGVPWDLELELDRADGRRIWVRAMGRVEREGGRTLLYGAFSDISDQKAQELAAQAKDDQLQFVINGSNDGHWDWDLTTDEVWYSPRYLELLGYGPDEFRPSVESFAGALHPEDRDRVFADVERHLTEGAPYENEHRLRCKDGRYRWFRARGRAVRTADGTPVRLSGASSDITAQVEAVRALDDARRAAEHANRAKSDFLANMSHEIRTPMAAILGFTELLLDERTTLAQQRDYVDTIRRNGEQLLALINDILDLSKIEAGRLEVERLPVAVADEVDAVVRLMAPRAADKGLALEVVQPEALPRALPSDPLRLRQILTNLVGNAIKFTERGGVAIRLALDPEGGTWSLAVTDTGVGIPEEVRARLFRPFSQADSSTTRRFGGSGLGLAISRRLAEALGGTLELESEVGRGSTFTVRFPLPAEALEDLVPVRAEPAPAPRPEPRPVLDGRRILLADDGADNRKLIGLHLRRAGARVEFAEDGLEAVERMQRAREAGELPDAVLMDMQMPRLDGYAATRRLRELGFALPIVAVTAHAMSGDEVRCREAGCDGYLTKPVAPDDLRAALVELLEGPRPLDAGSADGSRRAAG